MTEITFNLEELLSIIGTIALILTPPAIIIGRHFWKKSQCFTAMQNKINSLDRHDKDSNVLHDDHEERLDKIEENQRIFNTKLETQSGYLRLILDELKIPYPKK